MNKKSKGFYQSSLIKPNYYSFLLCTLYKYKKRTYKHICHTYSLGLKLNLTSKAFNNPLSYAYNYDLIYHFVNIV